MVETETEATAEPSAASQVVADVSAPFKRMLPVKLTMERMVEHIHDLTRVTNSIVALESEADELARARKGVVGQVDGARDQQAEIIRTLEKGEEFQPVECVTVKLFDTNTLRVIRQDTQELVEERALTADERQAMLFEPTDTAPDDYDDDGNPINPCTACAGKGEDGEGVCLRCMGDGTEPSNADDAPPVDASQVIAEQAPKCTVCHGAGGFIAAGSASGPTCKHCGGSGDEPQPDADLTNDQTNALLAAITAED